MDDRQSRFGACDGIPRGVGMSTPIPDILAYGLVLRKRP